MKKNIFRARVFFTLVMMVMVLYAVSAQENPEQLVWNVNNIATWIEAVNGIRNGGSYKNHIITVSGNFSVPITPASENTFGSAENIRVTVEGDGTISPSSANGNLLRIGKGQTIIIKDITLKGLENNEGSVVITAGEFIMEGSAKVTGNQKKSGSGGGIRVDDGIFTMKDNSMVSDNSIGYAGFREGGGGICVNAGTFIMQDSSVVSGNSGNGYAEVYGGVFVRNGNFIMKDTASVKDNTGSGVGIDTGTFTMQNRAIIQNNTGRGIYIDVEGGTGTVIMQDNSIISGNSGGGVFVYGGVRRANFTMQDNVSLTGNSSNQGGGLIIGLNGIATIKGNATITDNKAIVTASRNNNDAFACGGGVYVDSGTLILSDNASISNNLASATSLKGTASDPKGGGNVYAYGGGVYIEMGSFNMNGGMVSGNTVNAIVSSSDDKARSDGGGVYVSNDRGWPNFTMAGGTVSGNNADTDGGGVYVDGSGYTAGRFTMQGGTVSGNTAGNNGGGIYIIGQLTKNGGTIHGSDAESKEERNTAANHGDSLYSTSGPQWRNVTAGPMMNPDTYGFWLND